MPPSLQRHKTRRRHNVNLACAVPGFFVAGGDTKPRLCVGSHSRHVCCVAQQTCLLCHTAEISASPHSRHVCVCCVTQQTALLCHTADMTAVSQQTCLLCHTADTSAVPHSRHVCCDTQMSAVSCSRHVCCVAQQTCLLCHTA